MAGIAVRWNLFDGGQARKKVRIARTKGDRGRSQSRRPRFPDRPAGSAAHGTTASKRKISLAVATDAVAQSEENLRVVRERYQAGSSRNVEVLDAAALHERSSEQPRRRALRSRTLEAQARARRGGVVMAGRRQQREQHRLRGDAVPGEQGEPPARGHVQRDSLAAALPARRCRTLGQRTGRTARRGAVDGVTTPRPVTARRIRHFAPGSADTLLLTGGRRSPPPFSRPCSRFIANRRPGMHEERTGQSHE